LLVKSRVTRWNPKIDNKPDSNIPRIKFAQKFSKKYANKASRMLDIGCGTGSYTYLIDRRNSFGIDLDPEALKIAKAYCTESNFIAASALHLPFKAGTFGVVFMWGVMEQLPLRTEKQAIIEASRVLDYNGMFLLSATNDHIISKVMDPAFLLCRQRHYNINELLQLISEVGLTVKDHVIKGKWYTITAISVFYFHKYFLHKLQGRLLRFFYNKSEKEFESKKGGISTIFIAMEKGKKENQIM
jgi:ubiquinone/menaquinone biosynthesis C-methylase UbiE